MPPWSQEQRHHDSLGTFKMKRAAQSRVDRIKQAVIDLFDTVSPHNNPWLIEEEIMDGIKERFHINIREAHVLRYLRKAGKIGLVHSRYREKLTPSQGFDSGVNWNQKNKKPPTVGGFLSVWRNLEYGD